MNEDPESVGNEPDPANDAADTAEPAGLDMKDPTDTDHPAGRSRPQRTPPPSPPPDPAGPTANPE